MPYNPRTYSEYKNGLEEGQGITVDDNTVNTTYTIPLLGKDYQDYAPIISQQVLYLTENYNTRNAFSLASDVIAGSIIYNNSDRTINFVLDDTGSVATFDPSNVDVDGSSLIPSLTYTYDIGTPQKRWKELHTDNLYVDTFYINKSDGTSLLLEDAFRITSDEVTHVGALQQNNPVTSVLDYVSTATVLAPEVVELDESFTILSAIENRAYVYVGSVPTTMVMEDGSLTDLISFNIVATNGNSLTVQLPPSTGDRINNIEGETSFTVTSSVTVLKENKGTYNSWQVTGGYAL